MPRVLVILLHVYLMIRIVCCPCLSGQNVHDRTSRSFFAWGGAESVPSDDLGHPDDVATEAGACMCDGASTTSCPDCPPVDRVGVSLDLFELPALISSISLDGFAPDRRISPPFRGPDPLAAQTVRAQLQNFRC